MYVEERPDGPLSTGQTMFVVNFYELYIFIDIFRRAW